MGEEKVQATGKASELPSVEDRTMFLGCLTCIVASSYDFDMTVEGSTKDNNEDHTTPDSKNTDNPNPKDLVNTDLQAQSSIYFDETETDTTETSDSLLDQAEKVEHQRRSSDNDDKAAKKNIQRAIKIQEKMQLAEQRHFVRRYKVAKEFILKSAEHLLLKEADVTNEFLPKLDALLEDGSNKDHKNKADSSSNKLQQVLKDPESHALKSATSVDSLEWVEKNDDLQYYLDKLNSKPAYQCLCWVVFEHLLNSEKTGGYDARVRFWFKSLAVTLWVRDFENDPNNDSSKSALRQATKKWESLEASCAERLLTLAAADPKKKQHKKNDDQENPQERKSSFNMGNIWKGVQIGGVGVGAGILLAVTGGLAAPGIAAGLAALGMGAVAGTFLSLASSAAVVSLFGVAGGSLAAYKMNRRVSGLTEFSIQQELLADKEGKVDEKHLPPPQLFRTIAVSGWLHDLSDFQRPWGVTPRNPPIQDKVELLQRFYYVHNPQLVKDAEAIWKIYKGEPEKLWKQLEKKYGSNPDQSVFGNEEKEIKNHEQNEDVLSEDELQQLDKIIVDIGKVEGGEDKEEDNAEASDKKDNKKGLLRGWGTKKDKDKNKDRDVEKSKKVKERVSKSDPKTQVVSDFELVDLHESRSPHLFGNDNDPNKPFEPPAHLNTIWNYRKQYGGELYTVKWESDLMIDLSDSIRKLALELASSVGQQVLKTTIASTLVLAAALPLTIGNFLNNIDATWTLVLDRSDEAGKELARSLLVNKGGHRPVSLVGYSFGARIVYAALKELAQYQQKWEEHQIEQSKMSDKEKKDKKSNVVKVGDLEFEREPASIVEDAIIMGAPKYLSLAAWKACREVVSGRVINVYSRKDKVLSYIFKYKKILGSYQPVVGTCTIAVPGIENVDVSDIVASHEDYSTIAGKILERVRFGQPVRYSSNALDEVALLEEAKNLAEKEKAEGRILEKNEEDPEAKKSEQGDEAKKSQRDDEANKSPSEGLLRGWQ